MEKSIDYLRKTFRTDTRKGTALFILAAYLIFWVLVWITFTIIMLINSNEIYHLDDVFSDLFKIIVSPIVSLFMIITGPAIMLWDLSIYTQMVTKPHDIEKILFFTHLIFPLLMIIPALFIKKVIPSFSTKKNIIIWIIVAILVPVFSFLGILSTFEFNIF